MKDYPLDYDDAACERIDLVTPYTMTSREKLYALINAVRDAAHRAGPQAQRERGG